MNMNKLAKFVDKKFEGCENSPLIVNRNNKYKKGGRKRNGTVSLVIIISLNIL